MWTTPELAPPLLTPTPHQREDVSALDRFNVHRCPTRRVFNGIGFELVARQATVRYLYHSATAANETQLTTDLSKDNLYIYACASGGGGGDSGSSHVQDYCDVWEN
ncbi:uncharacterized protein TNCV_780231 [Trichonephila clavipes]|nr:uncharacterized protein TNCV_780231 [Trichonephila clavipes]